MNDYTSAHACLPVRKHILSSQRLLLFLSLYPSGAMDSVVFVDILLEKLSSAATFMAKLLISSYSKMGAHHPQSQDRPNCIGRLL